MKPKNQTRPFVLMILMLLSLMTILVNKADATGACVAARFHDWQDFGCDQLYAGLMGRLQGRCPSCDGMPQWWVSEPYINLCMEDTPLSYTMSSGKEMEFSFYYRQRTKIPDSDEVWPSPEGHDQYPPTSYGSNCGTNASWGNNWTMSIQIWDPVWDSKWVLSCIGSSTPYSFSGPYYGPYTAGYQAFVWQPEGGISYYNLTASDLANGKSDPKSQIKIKDVSGLGYPLVETKYDLGFSNLPTADANGIYWGDAGIGVKLVYPDGSQDVFSLSAYPISTPNPNLCRGAGAGDSNERLFLTQRIDPQGRITHLGYENVAYTNFWSFPYQTAYFGYRVKYVVDPDGRTNTFGYSPNTQSTPTYNLWQLKEIDDPYGRKATITYNASHTNAPLTSITDAAGMTSSFAYKGGYDGWITNLTTPYGATRFYYYQLTDDSVTDGFQQRAIYANEPEGAGQFFYYAHTNAFLAAWQTSPTVPGQTNFDDGTDRANLTPHYPLTYRNTYHWGRRQFAALISQNSDFSDDIGSAAYYAISNPSYSQSEFVAALNSLGGNDYHKADIKHWLLDSDQVSITASLSSEQEPSLDAAGTIPGLRTWYNYLDKPSPELLGDDPQISCIARLLPDGSSQYTLYSYYPAYPSGNGLVASNQTTYSKPDGSIGLLTNWVSYAANGVDVTSVSNSVGQQVTLGYNGNHEATSIVNALDQTTTLSWDASTFNLTGIESPSGQSESLTYSTDSSGYPILHNISWSPSGRSFTINSYTTGLPYSVTDDRGLSVTNSWDGLNRLTGTIFPDGTTLSNVYYRIDLAATKDRLGNWTRYSYDSLRHLTAITNANNAITYLSWCGCGSLASILDPLGHSTDFSYDNQANLTNILFPDSTSLTYQYDLAGRMTNAYDGAGRSIGVSYNIQGLPTAFKSSGNALQQVIYDAVNRPISITDANGVTVTNTYDAINELLTRKWPDGIGEGFGYSAAGLIAYTNRDGKTTHYGLDAAGRIISVTNANNEVVKMSYDSLDNVVSLIDGLTHQTTWQYNQYGWLTNKIDALNRNIASYAYNANGWVTNRLTPEKGNTGYTYDNVGNLQTITYPQSSISYAYDGLNRLTNMVDVTGTTAFGYTAVGQLQSETGPWSSDALTYTLGQGLRTAMAITQPSGSWSQSYGYDSLWRMTNVISPAGTFVYNYNSPVSSLISKIALPNSGSITNGYDSLGQLYQTALNNSSGKTLDASGYLHDALGLRTNITRYLGSAISTVSVGYDAIGQLTSWMAKETNTVRLNEQLGWGYDAADNVHYRTNNALVETFSVDAANQLSGISRAGTLTAAGSLQTAATSVTVNGQSAQLYADNTFADAGNTLNNGNNTFTVVAQNSGGMRTTNIASYYLPTPATLLYDNNGNLTNDGLRSFSYDNENELTNVWVSGQWRSSFIYDGLGRRRIVRDYVWQSGAWVQTNEMRYVYDGYLPVQERDSGNNVLATYTRGVDLSGDLMDAGGIGGLLARTTSEGSTFYHADGIGNITALINGSQNVVARYLYNPFGQLEGKWGGMADANVMQFSSMPQHDGISLYDFRGYTPNLNRWLNQDPIHEQGGINLYQFAENSPVDAFDPFGLWYMLLGNKLYTPDMPNGVPVPPGTRDLAQITPHNDRITDLSEDYGNAAFNLLTAPETGSIKAGMLAVGLKRGLKTECETAAKALNDLPGKKSGWTKLKGNQGWRDAEGNFWKKDQLHKDHWDVSDRKGNKIREVDFEGNQIWPGGPKNKNK